MAENRISRDSDDREGDKRTRHWVRPQVLPEPTPEEGYAFRWIRLSTLGNVDATNISSKLREGWEPVKAKDHPEVFLVGTENEKFKDNVVIGGLILCKAPMEMIAERNEFYQNQAKAQVDSVNNNFMRENDARMPVFNENRSNVTFGKGK